MNREQSARDDFPDGGVFRILKTSAKTSSLLEISVSATLEARLL
jgi:hypothetical protein